MSIEYLLLKCTGNEVFLVYTNFHPKYLNPKTLTKMLHGLELSDSAQIFTMSVLDHKEQESAWGLLKIRSVFFIATLMYIYIHMCIVYNDSGLSHEFKKKLI